MAETRESKILIRSGENLVDLPILDPGEFGYTTIDKKLFIGNQPYEADSASDGVTTSYYLPLDARLSPVHEVWVNDALYPSNKWIITSNTLTITTPSEITGSKIEVKYNTQVALRETSIEAPVKTTVTLNDSIVDGETGFAVETTKYDVIFIDYSIKSNIGLRVGNVRIVIDGNDFVVDDNYNDTSPINVTFDGIMDGSVFKLRYTNPDNQATFSYVAKAWKS